MPTLNLTKHHGLGNDFLVLLDRDGASAPGDLAALARHLCHRRRGIGADGLIVATPAEGAHARMVLHNADGGRAEMSGNGIRCLGQALVAAGWAAAGEIRVLTDAGVRLLEVAGEDRPGECSVRVGMGVARVVRLGEGEAEVDTGNPHLVVLVDDPAGIDLEVLGARHRDRNVEVARVDSRLAATMRVHERGVGLTEACGTGSCAVATATLAWGLTESRVTVHNPGGDLQVEVADGDCFLTGPAVLVARIEVPWP
ncbi:MAG TPA: diaminopimelate epimerase [Acidimicrobiales bacterium]|nr:diaminopimelate epimerase [Acidimicrobiales bacterium]